MDQKWLTSEEAAEYSGFSVHTIRDAVSSGELAGTRRSTPKGQGHWRFTTDQIDAWLNGYATAPRPRTQGRRAS